MLDIDLQTIHSGYDRKTCWVHARPAVIPGTPPTIVVTMHKLRLTGSDVFYPISELRSDDGGTTWEGPVAHSEVFARHPVEGGIEEGVSDWWPAWHAPTGILLGTGHTVRYLNDDLHPHPRPRDTTYSTYDVESGTWAPWRKLELPDQEKFFMEGAGSTQRVDLPNGEVLLPTYFGLTDTAEGIFEVQLVSTVLRCAFDGRTLTYLEHGDEFTVPSGRGLAEPSLAECQGRFFLTLRNNDRGYVTSGTDGLHFDELQTWTFDDGADLGSYNTQQHWVTLGDRLYLVYTRRGANNDHVVRHRAPLFIGEVDQARLCVIRDTEQILVPERGARLGNFGVARISDRESCVVVSEWMQTTPPDPFDCTVCERYGSDNSIFLATVRRNE